jgi:hypothetical protein
LLLCCCCCAAAAVAVPVAAAAAAAYQMRQCRRQGLHPRDRWMAPVTVHLSCSHHKRRVVLGARHGAKLLGIHHTLRSSAAQLKLKVSGVLCDTSK